MKWMYVHINVHSTFIITQIITDFIETMLILVANLALQDPHIHQSVI